MSGPLAGVRVLDFSQVISGPFAATQLAMMGADVIKIEHPGVGDQGRVLTNPAPEFSAAGQSSLFMSMNAGKRSLGLDLKHPGAREVVRRLAANADVMIQNLKAGVMTRLGYGPEVLREMNPRLVYCSISGYGQEGPRAHTPAYDPVVQATSGMMSLNGYEETGPTKVGFWVTDMATGVFAAMSISAALYERHATGRGRYIDLSMNDAAISFISPSVVNWLTCGVQPRLNGNGSPVNPTSTVYETADGFVQVAAATQAQFEAQCRVLGLPELIEDPRFKERMARNENMPLLREALIPAYRKGAALHWEKEMIAAGVPAGAVLDIPGMTQDPQVAHREVIRETPPPKGLDRPVAAIAAPFHMDGEGFGPPRPAPAIGEHTEQVLTEAGFSAEEIAALRADRII